MKIYRTITRYYLIINKIRESKLPSFKEIKEFLSKHDFDISRRTLQRDLDSLRKEFFIEITYDKAKEGYFIDMEESPDYDYFLRFFEMSMVSGTLSDSLKSGSSAQEYMALDTDVQMQGMQYINKLVHAIKSKVVIEITYQRFYDDSPFVVSVLPGLLKEYQNRWYIIGINKDLDQLRTYGLDRIKSVELTTELFDKSKVEGIKDHFNHVLGIGFPDNPRELIELSFTPEQGQYIKTLKIHHTQTVIKDNEDEVRVVLDVSPNYELKQKIMSFGDRVTVIKPDKLRKEIIQSFKEFIKHNSKSVKK